MNHVHPVSNMHPVNHVLLLCIICMQITLRPSVKFSAFPAFAGWSIVCWRSSCACESYESYAYCDPHMRISGGTAAPPHPTDPMNPSLRL